MKYFNHALPTLEYSQAMTCTMSPNVCIHCHRTLLQSAMPCCSAAVLRDSPLCLLLLAAAYKLYLIVIIFLLRVDKSYCHICNLNLVASHISTDQQVPDPNSFIKLYEYDNILFFPIFVQHCEWLNRNILRIDLFILCFLHIKTCKVAGEGGRNFGPFLWKLSKYVNCEQEEHNLLLNCTRK